MTRGSRLILAAGAAALLGVGPAAAVPSGSTAAAESLALCDAVDDLPDAERDAAIARGLAMAEAALATNDGDGRAHFALFCHLGKRMQRAGISFSHLADLRRLKREIDIALALAPNDPDALAAKGALLLELPRLFGGDAAEAEVLLRRALLFEPDNSDARCYLAAALRARGVSRDADAPPDC